MTTKTISVESFSTRFAAILLGVIGAAVFIVQPGVVQGFVEAYGFSEQQAGYIASVEVWGIALTTLKMAFFNARVSWRLILYISAALFSLGNVASLLTQDQMIFSIMRFITGLGAGGLISLSFTTLGLTRDADRNFGYLIMSVLTYGALGLWAVPWALETVGMTGILVFFALFGLLSIPFIGSMPDSGSEHHQVSDDAIDLAATLRWLAIGAMFVYFFAQGIIWAYLFLIGVNGGVSEQGVANGLMVSQFLGVAGAFLPAVLGNRFGRVIPLTAGILTGGFVLTAFYGAQTALIYSVTVCVYNFAWNMTHPFLLGAMSSFDMHGRVVAHAVAAQMLGLAVGPALGAYLLEGSNYDPVITAGMILFLLSWVLIMIPVLAHRKALKAQR